METSATIVILHSLRFKLFFSELLFRNFILNIRFYRFKEPDLLYEKFIPLSCSILLFCQIIVKSFGLGPLSSKARQEKALGCFINSFLEILLHHPHVLQTGSFPVGVSGHDLARASRQIVFRDSHYMPVAAQHLYS